MFVDIVVPSGNEEAMMRMAERLGIDGLVFLYHDSKGRDEFLAALQERTEVRLFCSLKGSGLRVSELSKGFSSADVVVGVPAQVRHSVYKELARKKVAVCFPLIGFLDSKDTVALLESVTRGIRLCRKHKVAVAIATFADSPYRMRSRNELRSLFLSLGMSTAQARDGLGLVAGRVIA
ncbi:hypothetical protein HY640_02455 [Candidatus Woesearchaeota archaeon]|nr:hypothetical protein [Candidatus Woesearchaeota archaeon]